MTFTPQNMINGPIGPNNDFVINGFMDVNQRGITSITSNGYPLDRMQYANSGMNGGASASPQAFPSSGFGDVPQNPENYLRISAAGSGGTSGHFTLFRYKFPYGSRLVSQLFTVELYARNDAVANLGVEGRLIADNGTTANDIYGIDGKLHDLGSANIWKRHRFLVNVPAWTPPSIGGAERFELLLWITMGADFAAEDHYTGTQDVVFEMVNFGMFPGNLLHVPEDLKGIRDPEMELARCLPFYERSDVDDDTTIHSANMVSGQDYYFQYGFKAPKLHLVPDLTILSQSHAGVVNNGSFTIHRVRRNGFAVQATPNADDVNGYIRFTWECNSEI